MINIQWLNLGPLNEARFGKRDGKKSADDVLYLFFMYIGLEFQVKGLEMEKGSKMVLKRVVKYATCGKYIKSFVWNYSLFRKFALFGGDGLKSLL